MIELTTKAENYAAEKTNEVMTKAIAQAYADAIVMVTKTVRKKSLLISVTTKRNMLTLACQVERCGLRHLRS